MFYFVVDFEMFDKNVVKEIGIASKYFSVGFTIKPPFHLYDAQPASFTQNLWLTRNIHCITWNEGDINYDEIPNVLQHFHHFNAIYLVKGEQKVKLLETLMPGVDVRNLEDFDCLKYEKLVKEMHHPSKYASMDDVIKVSKCDLKAPLTCHNHLQHKKSLFIHCARKKAQLFATWFSKNQVKLEQREKWTFVDESDDDGDSLIVHVDENEERDLTCTLRLRDGYDHLGQKEGNYYESL